MSLERPMLQVSHLNVNYGPIPALMDVSLRVEAGKLVAVLGANGAGKSSLLRAVSGVARDVKGSVEFDGRPVVRKGLGLQKLATVHLRPHQIVRAGMAHVPEGRQLFAQLSVMENLRLGGFTVSRRANRSNLERVLEYFPVLARKAKHEAGSLSGGEQQMLAIGRALMSRPRLLLLDEPSIGLAPVVRSKVFDVVQAIVRNEGCSVLLVEQEAESALRIADYGYVLESPGHIVLEGPAAALREESLIRKAYLGR